MLVPDPLERGAAALNRHDLATLGRERHRCGFADRFFVVDDEATHKLFAGPGSLCPSATNPGDH